MKGDYSKGGVIMGKLLKRLGRITSAKIEKLISAMETPEEIIPQLLEELKKEGVETAKNALATALSTQKRREIDVAGLKDNISILQNGAESYVAKGDEASARNAIKQKNQLSKDLKIKEGQLEQSKQSAEAARSILTELQASIALLEEKYNELKTRHTDAEATEAVSRKVGDSSLKGSGSVSELDSLLKRFEEEVTTAEAMNTLNTEKGPEKQPDMVEKLRKESESQMVEDELAKIKARSQKPAVQ
ncbi:PspA/IM30 family protein [Candidatus Woesearchaeota archaeon]|nr:PspA/IM30 family protein [Candidatus Woesearchaeota archaeon]